MAIDLNSYGSYIGSIIIMMVFIIGIIIIIDELYNITKFCYRYTYLYNYGKANETTCKESKLEYETARFRIYNEIANYKFNKDLFSKSWLNYAYLLSVLIMTILLCIAFGYLFKYLFIDNNLTCNLNINDNDKTSTIGWSPLKLLLRCFCGDCHKMIPNCFTNYLMLFIIIFIYPLIYILKVAIKMDLTWNGGSYMTKIFHIIFFSMLIFYVYYIYSEEEDIKDTTKGFMKPKYYKIIIYLIFVTVFYVNNYLFDFKFNEYNNLSLLGNSNYKSNLENDDDVDTMFFDIYKQEEPIKPLSLDKPSFLSDFKYCISSELTLDSKNSYCSNMKYLQINTKTTYPRLSDNSYKCLYNSTSDPTLKIQIDQYLKNRDYYAIDKLIIDDYYKKLKKYDNDLQMYNIKYNIYKNNKIEFPDIVYFLFHMCPKMTGIDKTDVQLLLILIIIVSLLTIYLRMNNNPHTNYIYYTIYLYLLGMISITVLVNAILTYNTYVNKYLIYEPIHNYKNSLYNKNIIFNMIINNDDRLKEIYKLNSTKFNTKISSISLLSSEYKYKIKSNNDNAITVTLTDFFNRIKKKPEIINDPNDFYNINSPEPPLINSFSLNMNNANQIDYIFNIQVKFYRVIYSFMLFHNKKADINLDNTIKSYFLINRTQGSNIRNDNYVKFNYYKNSIIDTIPYINVPNDMNLLSETQPINIDILYFLRLVESTFINSEEQVIKKIIQLKLNMDYYIYSDLINNINIYNNLPTTIILFKTFIDNKINYNESEIKRDNKDSTLTQIIKNYKFNYVLIENAFAVYSDFLKDFRKQIVRLFNTCGVSCDDNNYVDFINKFPQFKKKLFNIINTKDDSTLRFKSSRQEPNIDIYKRILLNIMSSLNKSITTTINLMKLYIRSFRISNSSNILNTAISSTVSSTVTSSKQFTNFKEGDQLQPADFINELITNYNIYNIDSERHISNDLIKQSFNIEPNYKKSKYDKFDDIDIKKMKISSDNVSWSFIILIIIFAIILIEPTVI